MEEIEVICMVYNNLSLTALCRQGAVLFPMLGSQQLGTVGLFGYHVRRILRSRYSGELAV